MNDPTDKYPQELRGFFVGIPNGCLFAGPFELLSNARYEKNILGPDFKVHHGVIKYISETVKDYNLYIVPDVEKE